MYKGLPYIVWFVLTSLVGIEVMVFIGLAESLQKTPMVLGEAAVFFLLLIIIGLVLLGAAWLLINRRKLPDLPLNNEVDTDYPAKDEAAPKIRVPLGTQSIN